LRHLKGLFDFIPQIKARCDAHNNVLRDLNHALKIVMFNFEPRFGPLGRDTDGRIYWALSPGIVERENALKILISEKDVQDGKRSGKGKRKGMAAEGRQEMKEWSWFVAVWGKRPARAPDAADAKQDKDDACSENSDDEDADEDEERWWGFWEPEEIRRLAWWVEATAQSGKSDSTLETSASTAGSTSESGGERSGDRQGPPTKNEVLNLVYGLEEYAILLEWRVRMEGADEESSVQEASTTTKGKAKACTTPATNFYR
jgi:hypothetical protein